MNAVRREAIRKKLGGELLPAVEVLILVHLKRGFLTRPHGRGFFSALELVKWAVWIRGFDKLSELCNGNGYSRGKAADRGTVGGAGR